MPLCVEIIRNNKRHVPEPGWTEYTLCAMYTAAVSEHDGHLEFTSGRTIDDVVADGEVIDFVWKNSIYLLSREIFTSPLVRRGEQTLLYDHHFESKGQVVDFKAGDILRAWRE